MLKVLVFALLLFPVSLSAWEGSPYVDSLKNLLTQADFSEQFEICHRLSEYYRKFSKDSSLVYAKAALRIAKTSGEEKRMAQAYDVVGRAHYSMGHFLLATTNFSRGLDLIEPDGDTELRTHLENSLGIAFASAGKYQEALAHFTVALKRFEEMGKVNKAASIRLNIGSLYNALDEPDQAVLMFEKALAQAQAKGNKQLESKALHNLGWTYEKLNRYDKALELHQHSLELGKKRNYAQQIFACLESMGRLYIKKGMFEEANGHFQEAIHMAELSKNGFWIQKLWQSFGTLAEAQGELNRAIDFLTLSLEKARELSLKPSQASISLQLATLEAKTGNFAQAYAHQLAYSELIKETYTQKHNQELIEMRAKLELDEKEAKIRTLQQERNKRQQRFTILLLLGALFLVALMGLYGRFRVKQRATQTLSRQFESIQQKNELLEQKNREIRSKNRQMNIQADEIRLQNEQLRRINADLEQFTYVASHDLREPLRTISGYMRLLKRRYQTKLDENARDFIDFATDGAVRMDELLKDLLAYSRIGRVDRPKERVSMQRILERVSHDLAEQTREKQGVLSYKALPQVAGYAPELYLLMLNLVSNALKFHRPGVPPRVRIRAEADGNYWVIMVSDNGIGIEAKYQESIFKIFHRLHTRDDYEGTGIGLALAKKIVENHDGYIWFDSKPDQGTTFFIKLAQA